MRRLVALVVVVLWLAAPARAQPSLDAVQVVLAQVEERARTLTRARDLTIDAMQQVTNDLAAHFEQLADLAAPYPVLAEMIPELQVRLSALAHAATLGTSSDVESEASRMLDRLEELRGRAIGLTVPPFTTD